MNIEALVAKYVDGISYKFSEKISDEKKAEIISQLKQNACAAVAFIDGAYEYVKPKQHWALDQLKAGIQG